MAYFLAYVSSATQLFSESELEGLLAECRANNSALGVTGALLYQDGNFMQVLEGHERVVREVYEQIVEDPRHHDVIFMLDGQTDQRQFKDWSMAFGNLDDADSQLGRDYSSFVAAGRPRASVGQRLLSAFRRTLNPSPT